MKVVYSGPDPVRRLPPAHGGFVFVRGVPVDVPDELGRRLCEQPSFSSADKPKRRGGAAASTNPNVETRGRHVPDGSTSTETRHDTDSEGQPGEDET